MAPARKTCFYRFPMHPLEIAERSPPGLSDSARQLRTMMIVQIANLSRAFGQSTIDEKVFADVENGEIVGMDTSELMPGAPSMCVGDARVPLGSLNAENWITMRV